MPQSHIKQRAAFTLLLIMFSHLLLAQAKTDTIGSAGTKYYLWRTYKGEKIIGARKLSNILKQDPEAYEINKKAMRSFVWAEAMDWAVVATEICYRAANNSHASPNRNVPFLVTGCGFLAGSYVFLFSTIRNQEKAIRKFNADVQKTSYNEVKPQFYFSYTGCAIGVGLKF